MNPTHLLIPALALLIASASAPAEPGNAAAQITAVSAADKDFYSLMPTSAPVQFRICTNAAPDGRYTFNTFEISAHGHTLLSSPPRSVLDPADAPAPATVFNNLLVNGIGPELAISNSITLIQETSGPDWRYASFDLGPAYRQTLKSYTRSVLCVESNMFVVYDRLAPREPAFFLMQLHPPASTTVDSVWGGLKLELDGIGLSVDAPASRDHPRNWRQVQSPADMLLPGTVTMQLGATNKLAALDLITVFVVHRKGEKQELAFKLLESTSAVGARIHRNGLPALIAFKIDPGAPGASLTGFEFTGPVGVSVFKPKMPKANR